jgi:hypothetical protein
MHVTCANTPNAKPVDEARALEAAVDVASIKQLYIQLKLAIYHRLLSRTLSEPVIPSFVIPPPPIRLSRHRQLHRIRNLTTLAIM